MQITFDPHNENDCTTIARLLGTAFATAPDARVTTSEQPDTATEQPDTAPAQTAPAEPDTAPTQPETVAAQPDTDCHGMTHDDAIHSTPASKNADGSWRAKRGQKEVTDMRIIIACPDAPRIERAWRGCPGLTSFPFDRHIIRD